VKHILHLGLQYAGSLSKREHQDSDRRRSWWLCRSRRKRKTMWLV